MCPPTSTSDGEHQSNCTTCAAHGVGQTFHAYSPPRRPSKAELWAKAQELKLEVKDVCCICLEPIKVICMKGTGVCGERHRKIRDNEPDRPQAIAGI